MAIRDEEFDLCRQMKDFIVASAQQHDWRPELIAGIISRESRFGLILKPPGPGGKGDFSGGVWHGHGLMQIDDRSFGDWLANNDWQDPATNIEKGVQILAGKFNYLNTHGGFDNMSDPDAERASVAAYNCGEGTVLHLIKTGQDVDTRTAGGDYSADVLARAEAFKECFA